MKKYYKTNLYKLADYKKVKMSFYGVVLDYGHKDELNSEKMDYMRNYLPIMEMQCQLFIVDYKF